MKRSIVIAMTLALSACGNTNFYGDSVDDASPTADIPAQSQQGTTVAPAQAAAVLPLSTQSVLQSPVPATQATASSQIHCKALAKQRAMDAAFQGEDGDTQESVYNRTYSDCVAWDMRHNL